jgi:nucleoside-diphosphate-sugar epimerase
MRIFMSGATGVIGKRAIPILVSAGHQVSASGRTPEKRAQLEKLGASATNVDLFNPEQVRAASSGQDAVINLATHIPPVSKIFLRGAWRENDRIRSVASGILVKAAIEQNVRIFIQEAFAPVYQDAGDRWIDERVPISPVRYNRSLLDAESAVQGFTDSGRTGIVLRFAAFYGPDSEQGPMMLRSIRKGWAPIPGRRDGYLSSVSHDDAASAVAAALKARAGIYNIVDDEPLRREDFFNYVAELIGVKPPKFLPAWTSHLFGSLGTLLARSLRISNRKFRGETSWKPIYPSARDGLHDIVTSEAQAA